MGSGRGGLHEGTWGSHEGEELRARVGDVLRQFGGSAVGDAAADLADALVRIAVGESPDDSVPEPREVAFDLALDALSSFVPGGGRVTRELAMAARTGKSARKAGSGIRRVKGARSSSAPHQVWLEPDEYAMVMSALNNMYHARLKGYKQRDIPIGEHTYTVLIHDFDEYTIIGRKGTQ